MKSIYKNQVSAVILFFVLLVGHSLNLSAQETNAFKRKTLVLEKDNTAFLENKAKFKSAEYKNKVVVLATVPSDITFNKKDSYKKQGIDILEYHGNDLYTLALPTQTEATTLNALKIRAISTLPANFKLSKEIQEKDIPTWAKKTSGKTEVAVVFHDLVEASEVKTLLASKGITFENAGRLGKTVTLVADDKTIQTLAELPQVAHIDVVQSPDEPLMTTGRAVTRANFLNNARGLNGKGVTIGIGDGGSLYPHIDFVGRNIDKASGTYSSYGDHGDHVTGIIGAAGNLNPIYRGIASEATLLSQKTSNILSYSAQYFTEHGMVITNNSYGSSFACSSIGTYNYTSQNIDWQINTNQELIHVFAAGNAGSAECSPYPVGFYTMLRAYGVAKNGMTVGNFSVSDMKLSASSSRGPVADGRIKPEVVAPGDGLITTGANYAYTGFGGASASTPNATGVLALVYERYRQLNKGANPNSGLVKALVCNTADDLGNPGPDYLHGFGLINARRAIDVLEANNFYVRNIDNGGTQTFNITLPAGAKQLRAMLYWHDKEAAAYPTKALVNDLDLVVVAPNGTEYKPWVLNHNPNNVNDNAIRAVDTLNNIEQVTIDVPAGGNYILKVRGKNVPMGPQTFALVYEILQPTIIITSPVGGDALNNHATPAVHVQWDAYDNSTAEFKLEYSLDGGKLWQNMGTAPAAARHFIWTLPSTTTDNATIKISRDGQSATNTTPFRLMPSPKNLTATLVCNGSISLSWEALPFASQYEVFKLGQTEMELVATTTTNYANITNLTLGKEEWFAVRAKNEKGATGARSTAIRATPNTDAATCVWEHDVQLAKVEVEQQEGREYTSTAINEEQPIYVEIKNNGTKTATNIPVAFRLNEGQIQRDTCRITLASGELNRHRLSNTIKVDNSGTYNMQFWLDYSQDQRPVGDTIANFTIVNLPNDVVEELPLVESFNSTNTFSYTEKIMGVPNYSRADFLPSENGALVFAERQTSGMSPSAVPDGAMFLRSTLHSNINELVITYNMTNFSTKNLALKLDYKYNSGVANEKDAIWARGNDGDDWVEIMKFENKTEWTNVEMFNISNLFANNGQVPTSSFQLRIVQNGAADLGIDNIGLHDGATLPVELLYFTAQNKGTDVLLRWETASETNNSHFEVEVANGEKDFRAGQFKNIGRVEGNGTLTSATSYNFTDKNPNTGENRYYRLKQVDYDGSFAYSPVIVLKNNDADFTSEIYPNPFTSNIFVQLDIKEAKTIQVQIFNAAGAEVKLIKQDLPAGKNVIPIQLSDDLPNGNYFVRLTNGEFSLSKILIKQSK